MNKLNYKILTSACLLGERVRYDAQLKTLQDPLLDLWRSQNLILPVCPEVLGGLSTPRPAAEIQVNGRIQTGTGEDVTKAFQIGAQKTLALALQYEIKIAILTERSPSCGSTHIYDGSFSTQLIDGQGMTAELLRDNGIRVFNQFQLKEVQKQLVFEKNYPGR